MTAPVFQTSTKLAGADSTTAPVAVPASVASGDVIVLSLYKESTSAVTPPAGFTLKTTLNVTGAQLHNVYLYWKRASGADTGTYDFTWTGTAWREAWAARFSGVIGSGDPFDSVLNSAVTDSSSSSTVTPAVTTLTPNFDDSMVIFGGTNYNGSGASWTPPSGFTERLTDPSEAVTLATLAQSTRTATGSVTATSTASGSGRSGLVAVLLAATVAQTVSAVTIAAVAAVPAVTVTVPTNATVNATTIAAVASVPTATVTGSLPPFPQSVQDIGVEIELDGTWTAITEYARRDPGVTITRGRPDESGTVDPSRCRLALDNRDGRFSPRNPVGAYFGSIGRNTPLRVSILSDRSRMPIDTNTGTSVDSFASTPDVAALDLTTDFDIRCEADLDSWFDTMQLVTKWTTTGNQRSYGIAVSTGGLLRLFTSVAGTATTLDIFSTQRLPLLYGHQAVRATFDADNGASGNTATFFYSDTISGSWTQLGDPVITAGTTTLFSSTSLVHIGPRLSGGPFSTATRGKILAAQIRSSIGGTIVANPDFTDQIEAATSFADSTGKTWTMTGTSITLRDYRFVGEVSAWPQHWDQTGSDVYTDVEASGILRRLGQGQAPVPSSIHRTISSTDAVVAYWPAEDGDQADRIGSAFPGDRAMVISGTPDLASNSDWVASDALPTLNFASFTGPVEPYTSTNNIQVRLYVSIPAAGITNNTVIATVRCSGTAPRWELVYGTGGNLSLFAYDSAGAQIADSGLIAFAMNGTPGYVNIRLIGNGSDIDYNMVRTFTNGDVQSNSVDTLTSRTVGRCHWIRINPDKLMDDVVMGHFSVQSNTTYLESDISDAVQAWTGEPAGARIKRLCLENSIPFFQIASVDETELMGFQGVKPLLELLRECENADLGILYEPRDNYGLEYRPRKTLNNQNPVVTTEYTDSAMSTFQPTEDDQNLVNDVTVTRENGSSYRASDTTSALSTQAPPDGVGVYDTSVSLSLASDDQLPSQAGWRLHLGTVDEARYPAIGFDLTSPSFLAVTDLTWDVLALDIGDRMVVTGSPAWLPPDDVSQLAQGFTEYLANFERRIEVNCSPASVWEVARYAFDTDDTLSQYKYSSDGTVTTEALDTTETGIDVTTASGPTWTTDAAQLPFDLMIAGERMTLTAVSGTTANQVFTVTRSVNGVVKSHASGAVVVLFRPARYGL